MEVTEMYQIRTKLTGVLVNDAQTNIREFERSLCGCWTEECLTLIREPDNKYDSNAIKVEANGKYIGYIPRGIAKDLVSKVDTGSHFTISQSWLNKSHLHEPIGVTVEITEVQ
jgi:hypothetical protein